MWTSTSKGLGLKGPGPVWYKSFRLSDLADYKFCVVVEIHRTVSDIGFGLCRFVGTVPGILGLVSFGVGADLGPKLTIFGRIIKSVRGPFSSADKSSGTTARKFTRPVRCPFPGPLGTGPCL